MPVVAEPIAPLYDGGWRFRDLRSLSVMPRSMRLRQTVSKPAYPLYDGWGLHGLGQAGQPEGPTILKAGGAVAATATTSIISSVASGTTLGSWAGPIGAGVGILVGIIAGLWAAHDARVKGATAENQAINSAVSTWDQGMKAIFAAANSSDPSQNVSGADAAQQVQALYSQFWGRMAPYMHAPGTADTSGGGVNCGSSTLNPAGACAGEIGGHKCDKSCTATCCVGCQDLYPSMLQAVQALSSPTGGTVQVCTVSGSSYGAQQRSGYTLTYTPPNIVSGGTDILGGLFGGTPGTGGMMPLLLLGLAAFVLFR